MEEKSLAQLRVPAFCPVCGGLMKGKSTGTFYAWGCCINCYIWFLEMRPAMQEAWKAGSRPSAEHIQRMREFMKD
jgi:hypothetical protein